MTRASRYLAFFAYLLSIPGALFVLIARRDDPFAVFHARQSLALWLTALLTPVIWAIVAWMGVWIPVVGPLVGLTLFALVIAAFIGLTVSWIMGMIYALEGKASPVPLGGSWLTRRRKAASTVPAESTQSALPELIEGTTPDA